MKEQATFLNVKEHLENKGFKIHIAFQDTREDEGDDGSYGIFLTERKDKFYVQVVHLSFYGHLARVIICEEDWFESGFPDYVIFDTMKDAVKFIKRFMQTLFIFKTMQDFQNITSETYQEQLGLDLYWEDAEDFRSIIENDNYSLKDLKILDSISKDVLCEWLFVCFNPFCDYPLQDIRRMNENFKTLSFNDYDDFIFFDLTNFKLFDVK
jgi:hypothetical protein